MVCIRCIRAYARQKLKKSYRITYARAYARHLHTMTTVIRRIAYANPMHTVMHTGMHLKNKRKQAAYARMRRMHRPSIGFHHRGMLDELQRIERTVWWVQGIDGLLKPVELFRELQPSFFFVNRT